MIYQCYQKKIFRTKLREIILRQPNYNYQKKTILKNFS